MRKIYEKYKGKLVRLSPDVAGILVGYTSSHFILLLEEGIFPIYSFSLDELGAEEHYIDTSFETDCEDCFYAYCDSTHLTKKWNAVKG